MAQLFGEAWPLILGQTILGKGYFFYLQGVGVKRAVFSFAKRSLIPAVVFQSMAIDHKSALFKIKDLTSVLL